MLMREMQEDFRLNIPIDLRWEQGRPVGVRRSSGIVADARGDRRIASAVAALHFSGDYIVSGENMSHFDSLIHKLLDRRHDIITIPSGERIQALTHIFSLASDAATFGAGVGKFEGIGINYFPAVRLPPVESSVLIERGIITDEQSKAQIEARDRQLSQRHGIKGGEDEVVSSENWLMFKALSKDELRLFLDPADLSVLPSEYNRVVDKLKRRYKKRPVIFIQEYFTVTIPEAPQFDIDTVGNYLVFETPKGVELLFLGEKQDDPHYHTYNEGTEKWETVEYTNLGPTRKKELEDINIPSPEWPYYGNFEATNEQIAKMFVLFKYSAQISKTR